MMAGISQRTYLGVHERLYCGRMDRGVWAVCTRVTTYERQGRVTDYIWDQLADISKKPFIDYNTLRPDR
jgi:hypothetical protein